MWYPFKHTDQIFEGGNAIGLAGFKHAVTAALAVAPFDEAENSQFLRPVLKLLTARLQILLDIS